MTTSKSPKQRSTRSRKTTGTSRSTRSSRSRLSANPGESDLSQAEALNADLSTHASADPSAEVGVDGSPSIAESSSPVQTSPVETSPIEPSKTAPSDAVTSPAPLTALALEMTPKDASTAVQPTGTQLEMSAAANPPIAATLAEAQPNPTDNLANDSANSATLPESSPGSSSESVAAEPTLTQTSIQTKESDTVTATKTDDQKTTALTVANESKPTSYLGIRPVAPSTSTIIETFSAVGGDRPIFASTMQVKDTIKASGLRPISASTLVVSETYTVMGNRPVASNEIDDVSALMGYLD